MFAVVAAAKNQKRKFLSESASHKNTCSSKTWQGNYLASLRVCCRRGGNLRLQNSLREPLHKQKQLPRSAPCLLSSWRQRIRNGNSFRKALRTKIPAQVKLGRAITSLRSVFAVVAAAISDCKTLFESHYINKSNYLAPLRVCCRRGGKESETEIPFGKRFAQKYLLK